MQGLNSNCTVRWSNKDHKIAKIGLPGPILKGIRIFEIYSIFKITFFRRLRQMHLGEGAGGFSWLEVLALTYAYRLVIEYHPIPLYMASKREVFKFAPAFQICPLFTFPHPHPTITTNSTVHSYIKYIKI